VIKYLRKQLKGKKGLFWLTASEGSVHGHWIHVFGPEVRLKIMVVAGT
jgi:hypothetical protein